MRHRARTRYSNGRKHRGKVLSKREVARRIAQSFGWDVNNSTIMTKDAVDNRAMLSL